MNTWLTSDHHFFHNLVSELRGFASPDYMNDMIIRFHNESVSKTDVTYFLGDLTLKNGKWLSSLKNILKQMNGKKHLILGNHDAFKPFQYIDIGFESVHTSLELDEFIMVHDPAISCLNRDKICLCGHVHDLFTIQKNAINVGLDVWNFHPVSITVIRKLVKESYENS